jgi:predicted glycosyltransferase
MRYLFLTNTPAHVHLYRHVVPELRDRNHGVRILARDYGPTVELLEYYDLPYRVYGHAGTTKGSLARNLPEHCVRIPLLDAG